MAKKKTEEEIKAEETVAETPEETTEETAAEEVNEFEKKYQDVNDKYLRTLAEYDNYRKRTIKEKESIYPEAKAVVVEKFLPVMDNFQRAIDSAENKDAFYDGVNVIVEEFQKGYKIGDRVVRHSMVKVAN